MDTLIQDVRYGLRVLVKSPGITLTALFCLALGIGLNTAVFSIVNAILLRPLPYAEPERLVMVYETNLGNNITQSNFSFPNFVDFREQNQVFEQMAAYDGANVNVLGGEEPLRIQAARVSPNMFSLLGVNPILGRTFSAEEEEPSNSLIIIISHNLWDRHFGKDQNVYGKTLNIDGGIFTVVGVMPADFQFPINRKAEAWIPLTFDPSRANRGNHSLQVIARLKPGVSPEQVKTSLETITAGLQEKYPNTNAGWGATVVDLTETVVGDNRQILYILLASVGLVLLIACANVANLLLSRAAVRQKEIAIRTALGATRKRIVRQLLIESTVLGITGGLIGLWIAYAGTGLLVSYIPQTLYVESIGIDLWVLGFTLVVSLLTGTIFGLAPALQLSKPDLTGTLKEEDRGFTARRGRKLRSALVVSEVALALVLLIGSGLLIKSLLTLQVVNPGFNPNNLHTMQISLPRAKYPKPPEQASFFQQLSERIKAIPGVESAAIVNYLPLGRSNASITFTIDGRAPASPNEINYAGYRVISPDYFKTLGINVLSGRAFEEKDTATSPPVAIINDAMARRFFPDEIPVGRRLKYGPAQSENPMMEIVGVVSNVRHGGLSASPDPELYAPHSQDAGATMTVVVKSNNDPDSFALSLKSAVWEVDRNQPVYNLKTMGTVISDSMAAPRGYTMLLVIFAALALVLAAVGIYGVMAYSITQRTQEIGIRMALGAQRFDVLKLVLLEGMLLAAVGIVIGLFCTAGLTRFISSFLFGVGVFDLVTYAVITGLLLGIALLACYIPAQRAMRVDPAVALRHQ